MKDFQIRQILHETELAKFHRDGVSKVVDEMKLPAAQARIDVAIINGSFHGYEIKGASDTLIRLPNQIQAYSYVFDYLTIVTEEKYCEKIIEIVPEWVGVSVCKDTGRKKISVKQKALSNPDKNKFYIAKLLWHDELVTVLSELKIPFKKKYRNWILCEILAQNLDIVTLSDIVREKIKKRTDWRS